MSINARIRSVAGAFVSNRKIVCTLDKFHASALNRKNNETIDGFALTIPFRFPFCSSAFARFEFRRLSLGGTHTFAGERRSAAARKFRFFLSFYLRNAALDAENEMETRESTSKSRFSEISSYIWTPDARGQWMTWQILLLALKSKIKIRSNEAETNKTYLGLRNIKTNSFDFVGLYLHPSGGRGVRMVSGKPSKRGK